VNLSKFKNAGEVNREIKRMETRIACQESELAQLRSDKDALYLEGLGMVNEMALLRAEVEQLKAALASQSPDQRLVEALRGLLAVFHLTASDCEHLHHNKKERHGFDVPCPVSKRVRDAVNLAETAIAASPPALVVQLKCNRCGKELPPLGSGESLCSGGYVCRKCWKESQPAPVAGPMVPTKED
jgi:hypothetical protein